MNILVTNAGSTSLKFKLYHMPEEEVLCSAKVERVGSSDDAIFSYANIMSGFHEEKTRLSIPTYTEGIRLFIEYMTSAATGVLKSVEDISAVGLKTVLSKGYYGGHRLTEEVMSGMRDALFIAPVHNRAYLEAIEKLREILPDTPMVGVFETAFHTTIPVERRMYGVPYEWYEKYGLMKMGYHGASHSYIACQAPHMGKAENVISCHLGGSCSVCAIKDGRSVDTSFGLSLQTGVFHANRCGDTDSYMVPYLESQGLTQEEVLKGMSENGGLLGISGVSNDLRLVMEAADKGNERASLAVKMFVCSVVRYIGMFYAELGGLDQLVFTGGIGENSCRIREMICEAVAHMGVSLDEQLNAVCREGIISAPDSKVLVSVIPANEELGIARSTFSAVSQ